MFENLLTWLDSPQTLQAIVVTGSLLLFGIGFYGLLAYTRIIKILISLSIMESALFVFFLGLASDPHKTAPILGDLFKNFEKMNDPVPQAAILTAIVISLATMSLGISFAIEYYKRTGKNDIAQMDALGEKR
jgi:multicomponent Na+:H+ antiporter subunit C